MPMENLPAVNRQEKKKSEGKVKVKDKIIENNTRMPIRKFVWGLPAGPAGGLSRGGPAAGHLSSPGRRKNNTSQDRPLGELTLT